ncbi:MAG: hypothetical protein PHV82_05215 [Victivallaceae bacterium]|nr:hypothetical protein [Victivallaceae bacterium]
MKTSGSRREVACSFCAGTGRDPFDLLSDQSVCQVCHGRRKFSMIKPIMRCAFCRGSGIYPGQRITCTVCNGKGMVRVPKGTLVKCPVCKGVGTATDSGLPCLACKGKGMVAAKQEKTVRVNEKIKRSAGKGKR